MNVTFRSERRLLFRSRRENQIIGGQTFRETFRAIRIFETMFLAPRIGPIGPKGRRIPAARRVIRCRSRRISLEISNEPRQRTDFGRVSGNTNAR